MALTKKDINKLFAIFATKDEFKKGMEDLRKDLTDRILISQDLILKRFEDGFQEVRIMSAQWKRHDDKLEDHDKRITSLEIGLN